MVYLFQFRIILTISQYYLSSVHSKSPNHLVFSFPSLFQFFKCIQFFPNFCQFHLIVAVVNFVQYSYSSGQQIQGPTTFYQQEKDIHNESKVQYKFFFAKQPKRVRYHGVSVFWIYFDSTLCDTLHCIIQKREMQQFENDFRYIIRVPGVVGEKVKTSIIVTLPLKNFFLV